MYAGWNEHVDYHSKHRRLRVQSNPWADKRKIHDAFERLFVRYQNSILVVSYRSDGIPSVEVLTDLLAKDKSRVSISLFGEYHYALSTNDRSKEILLVGV